MPPPTASPNLARLAARRVGRRLRDEHAERVARRELFGAALDAGHDPYGAADLARVGARDAIEERRRKRALHQRRECIRMIHRYQRRAITRHAAAHATSLAPTRATTHVTPTNRQPVARRKATASPPPDDPPLGEPGHAERVLAGVVA